MVKAKEAAETAPIVLPQIRLETVEIPIVGDTSLLTNAWTAEKIDAIEYTQAKKAQRAKAARDPLAEYENAKYHLPDGGVGLPTAAFKRAAVEACRLIDGLPMTEAKVLFHVMGGDLVRIEGEPRMRRDMAFGSTAKKWTPVYRAEFAPWSCKIQVRYFANKISMEQIVNLFNLAGMGGVGCWRPGAPFGKSGNHGMFHVATN